MLRYSVPCTRCHPEMKDIVNTVRVDGDTVFVPYGDTISSYGTVNKEIIIAVIVITAGVTTFLLMKKNDN